MKMKRMTTVLVKDTLGHVNVGKVRLQSIHETLKPCKRNSDEDRRDDSIIAQTHSGARPHASGQGKAAIHLTESEAI